MKRKVILLAIFHVALFIPLSKAYMYDGSGKTNAPVAPMQGRKAEHSFYSMLSRSGPTYEKWVKDGRTYLVRKEFEQAIWAFRKARELRPAAEEARFLLAWTYEKRGLEGLPGDQTSWDELAETEYMAAIELADHLPARYNLAMLYRRNSELANARKQLEYILLTDSGTTIARMASNELSALFEQDVRPSHISTNLKDNYR